MDPSVEEYENWFIENCRPEFKSFPKVASLHLKKLVEHPQSPNFQDASIFFSLQGVISIATDLLDNEDAYLNFRRRALFSLLVLYPYRPDLAHIDKEHIENLLLAPNDDALSQFELLELLVLLLTIPKLKNIVDDQFLLQPLLNISQELGFPYFIQDDSIPNRLAHVENLKTVLKRKLETPPEFDNLEQMAE